MTTKLEKIARRLNDEFADKLADAVREKYGVEVDSRFSIFSMALITTRSDDEDFTPEQHAFISAFSDGYGVAMKSVCGAI